MMLLVGKAVSLWTIGERDGEKPEEVAVAWFEALSRRLPEGIK